MADVYVDPSIAANSGSGTSGDPYGDLQYALDSTSQGAAGDNFHIKVGTAEILAAGLTLATYGTPVYGKRLVFSGYTSAAWDGGVAEINCNGSYNLFASTSYSYISLHNLEIHNGGTASIIYVADYCRIISCIIHNTAAYGIRCGTGCFVADCEIYDCGNMGYYTSGASMLIFSTVFNVGPSYSMSTMVYAGGANAAVQFCHLNHVPPSTPPTYAIHLANSSTSVCNNMVRGNAATGYAIYIPYGCAICTGNIIFDWSGAGAIAIRNTGQTGRISNNFFYNNTANISNTSQIYFNENNTVLTTSPWIDYGSGIYGVSNSIAGGAWPENYRGVGVYRPRNLDASPMQVPVDIRYIRAQMR